MQVLTGNELLSGAVVYLTAEGEWVVDLQAARVFAAEEQEALDAALAEARAAGRIISLEAEAVAVEDGVIHPKRLRAHIRSDGPTAPRFERQSL